MRLTSSSKVEISIVESELLLLQKDEKVKVETENDINGRSNINRHENSFEGKDGTEILGSASTEKQYRLILRSKEKNSSAVEF